MVKLPLLEKKETKNEKALDTLPVSFSFDEKEYFVNCFLIDSDFIVLLTNGHIILLDKNLKQIQSLAPDAFYEHAKDICSCQSIPSGTGKTQYFFSL